MVSVTGKELTKTTLAGKLSERVVLVILVSLGLRLGLARCGSGLILVVLACGQAGGQVGQATQVTAHLETHQSLHYNYSRTVTYGRGHVSGIRVSVHIAV